MTSSESSSQTETLDSLEASNDRISSMPAIVTDKILKHLPLSVAANTSILSRTWRRMWLSRPYLVFDVAFWEDFCKVYDCIDWQKGSKIINSVLFHHNGRIHRIHIELRPESGESVVRKNESLSQWLSLLSRTYPKKIALINWAGEWSHLVFMPSYIFHCSELTKLKLRCFVLNPPPFDFMGFPHLKTLELFYVKFNRGIGMLWEFVVKCPSLVMLRLENCLDMDLLDVDAPVLKKLIIRGTFGSLDLKKAPCLTDVSLCSTKADLDGTETVVATIVSLAMSYDLQCLAIEGYLCKFLPAGEINKPLPVAFNHLNRLCLTEVVLSDSDVFRSTVGMIQSCPFVKDLEISIIFLVSDAVQHKYEYSSDNYKLERLEKVKITGITGTTADLKLIEYVLAISVVLDKLFFECEALDADSELKVIRQLIRFPRASTKAQLICLEE